MVKDIIFYLLLIIISTPLLGGAPDRFTTAISHYSPIESNSFDSYFNEKNGVGFDLTFHYPQVSTKFEIIHHYYERKKGKYNYDGLYFKLSLLYPIKLSDSFTLLPSIGVGDNRMLLRGYEGNEARSSESEFFLNYGGEFNYSITSHFETSIHYNRRVIFTRNNIERGYLGISLQYSFDLDERIKQWL